MFKYTPNKRILKKLLTERKRGWNHKTFTASYEYIYIRSEFSDYMTGVAFEQHWENTVFYSETKRDWVPVNGILFSVKYFDEESV